MGPDIDKQLHSMHSEHSLINMCSWRWMVAIIGKSYAHLVTHIFVSKSHLYDIKSNSYILIIQSGIFHGMTEWNGPFQGPVCLKFILL